jgi:fumarate hydratase, class II
LYESFHRLFSLFADKSSMIMVRIQVIGNDTTVAIAGSQGNFELNAMRPIITKNAIHSSRILADASDKVRKYSTEGLTLSKERISRYLNESLMLVTVLTQLLAMIKHHLLHTRH